MQVLGNLEIVYYQNGVMMPDISVQESETFNPHVMLNTHILHYRMES